MSDRKGKQHEHIYITLDTFQTNGAHDHDNHQGPQSHHTSSPADTPLCTVGKSKQRNVLSYCAAPQQLWIIYCYAKCAQISELEAIITVRRPHRQRMSSAANALLCNIGEGKQCNLLSYFSALQHLCGTRSCGKRARKGHFHGHEHTCTHTGRQSAQPPTLARPESKPATSQTFCAV